MAELLADTLRIHAKTDGLKTRKDLIFPNSQKTNTIFSVVFFLPIVQGLHLAHGLNLFNIIGHNTVSLQDVVTALGIELRPAQALVSICSSLDLIKLNTQQQLELTDTAKNFLLKDSPFYIGGMLDLTILNDDLYSLKNIKTALLTNASQVYAGKELFETNEQQAELAKIFTQAMHGKSLAMAGVWPDKIDLSGYECFLDIGGGSGAHSIAAVSQWQHLRAIVYERPAVCKVAQTYIEQFKLSQRIETQIGDMWKDPFPTADLHFYSDIFHDWSMEQSKFLIQKSYQALNRGGRILIHELPFNPDKTGPLSAASYNLLMLLWTQAGQQFSETEFTHLLTESGFSEVQVIPTGFGDWKLVTGIK